MVLLRFAPSPTGALHLGGLRTALLNHLYAKKHGGKWIMRVEDTDATRYVPGSVEGIRSALEWAGLDYDHGPGKGGPQAPYFQSERLDLYHVYSKKLLDSGHAYRCFCSSDDLTATRERLARMGSLTTYDKKCMHLTEEEVARRVRAGEKNIVRLNDSKLPTRSTPDDIVFGAVGDSHASLPTDPVLLKTDLFPTYHLANIVDDHEMGITHVLRGEEWLPSLALHLDLYACLNLTPPTYAHLPILLNKDGSKMSKRKGDVAVLDFIRRGWEPQALLNWLALAGWGHNDAEPSATNRGPDSTKVLTLPELIKEFDLSAVTHRRNGLDLAKLEYLNKRHLLRRWTNNVHGNDLVVGEVNVNEAGLEGLATSVHDFIKESFPRSQYTTVDHIKNVIRTLGERLTNILDIPGLVPFLFVEPDFTTAEALAMRKGLTDEDYGRCLQATISRLKAEEDSWETLDLSAMLYEERNKLDIQSKKYMTSLRHALSGMKTGPSLPEIMRGLGHKRTVARLEGLIPGKPKDA